MKFVVAIDWLVGASTTGDANAAAAIATSVRLLPLSTKPYLPLAGERIINYT
jgi:hypothetical protein